MAVIKKAETIDEKFVELAQIDSDLDSIKSDLEEKTAKIQAEYNQETEPLLKRREDIVNKMVDYAKDNEKSIKDKIIKFQNGTFSFGRTSTKLELIEGRKESDIIKEIETLPIYRKLKDCINIKKTLAKSAIMRHIDGGTLGTDQALELGVEKVVTHGNITPKPNKLVNV